MNNNLRSKPLTEFCKFFDNTSSIFTYSIKAYLLTKNERNKKVC